MERRPQGTVIAAACSGLGLLCAALAHSAPSEPVPASVRACRLLSDEHERVRCYDAVVDGSAPSAAVPIPPPSAAPARARLAPAAQAATAAAPTPPAAPSARASERSTSEASPSERMFAANIVALSFRASGAVNVTLDNGQVWSQYGPSGRVPLRDGDRVILRPGSFGASVLVGPSGWITKVHLVSLSTLGSDGK